METALAAIAAALIILMEHYWIPNRLPQTAKYTLGVLAINLPLSALLAAWGSWPGLAALWLVTLAAGAATILSHAIDDWRATAARLRISEREGQALRGEVGHGPDERSV